VDNFSSDYEFKIRFRFSIVFIIPYYLTGKKKKKTLEKSWDCLLNGIVIV